MNPFPGSSKVDVCVIGAGIAGLAARRKLREKGISTILYEKSRGAGGRMATRRLNGQITDLGAQFTAGKNLRWAEILGQATDDINEVSLGGASDYPRFVHRNGMSALARRLLPADAPDVFFSQRVITLAETAEGIALACETGLQTHARFVLLTPPVPQSLLLLESSGRLPDAPELLPLRSLQYDPCLAVIATLDEATAMPPPGILKNPAPGLAGIYDQGAKGLRTTVPTLVVHASAEASLALWPKPDAEAAEILWAEAAQYLASLALPVRAAQLALHRWRYCEPSQVFPAPYFAHGRFVFAGDAFGQSSVDGAFTSGEAAADFISGLW